MPCCELLGAQTASGFRVQIAIMSTVMFEPRKSTATCLSLVCRQFAELRRVLLTTISITKAPVRTLEYQVRPCM
jgi:hypothetical protein